MKQTVSFGKSARYYYLMHVGVYLQGKLVYYVVGYLLGYALHPLGYAYAGNKVLARELALYAQVPDHIHGHAFGEDVLAFGHTVQYFRLLYVLHKKVLLFPESPFHYMSQLTGRRRSHRFPVTYRAFHKIGYRPVHVVAAHFAGGAVTVRAVYHQLSVRLHVGAGDGNVRFSQVEHECGIPVGDHFAVLGVNAQRPCGTERLVGSNAERLFSEAGQLRLIVLACAGGIHHRYFHIVGKLRLARAAQTVAHKLASLLLKFRHILAHLLFQLANAALYKFGGVFEKHLTHAARSVVRVESHLSVHHLIEIGEHLPAHGEVEFGKFFAFAVKTHIARANGNSLLSAAVFRLHRGKKVEQRFDLYNRGERSVVPLVHIVAELPRSALFVKMGYCGNSDLRGQQFARYLTVKNRARLRYVKSVSHFQSVAAKVQSYVQINGHIVPLIFLYI